MEGLLIDVGYHVIIKIDSYDKIKYIVVGRLNKNKNEIVDYISITKIKKKMIGNQSIYFLLNQL